MTTTKDELEALSKSELIELVLKRQSTAAAAVPAAAAAPAAAAPPAAAPAVAKTSKSEHKKARAFDMSRYAQRHTALRVAYLGAAYSGSAYTPGADTVAGRLLEACTKTCLIADRESCGLTLGGRTDKGVSAFGQVFALRLRSNLPQAAGTSEASGGGAAAAERKEIDYVRVLNRVLPEDIRVLAAQPVPEDFSARFSATHRTYRYFFVRGELALAPMAEACARLQGEFDFRNFCKIDPAVTNFRRTVLSARIRPTAGASGASPLDVFEFEVTGTAFLYHQVRCMVAVLFLVGRGLEPPSIVDALLDIDAHPARPNYEIAPDGPLLLFDIGCRPSASSNLQAGSSHRRLGCGSRARGDCRDRRGAAVGLLGGGGAGARHPLGRGAADAGAAAGCEAQAARPARGPRPVRLPGPPEGRTLAAASAARSGPRRRDGHLGASPWSPPYLHPQVLRGAMLGAKREAVLAQLPAADGAAAAAAPKGYVPLLQRPTAATVEAVHAHAAERAGRKKRAAPDGES